MNLKSTFIATIYSVAIVFALSNCSAKKEEAHDESMHASAEEAPAQDSSSAPQFQVEAAFQQQLSAVFTSYISLKEAFVATDVAKVKEAAAKTAEALAKVDMMLLVDFETVVLVLDSWIRKPVDIHPARIRRRRHSHPANRVVFDPEDHLCHVACICVVQIPEGA